MPWLVSNAILAQVYYQLWRIGDGLPLPPGGYPASAPPSEFFYTAGQTLAVFVWAIAGGVIAGRFRRGEK
ncbi:MAG TPA: hypothetical protein VHC22_34050 [Pirellulales bacterium]|nr:hypothetical protein [Pirellulales bacterium]